MTGAHRPGWAAQLLTPESFAGRTLEEQLQRLWTHVREAGLLPPGTGPEELRSLLEVPSLAERLGHQAHEHVLARFTGARHLTDMARLLERIIASRNGGTPPGR